MPDLTTQRNVELFRRWEGSWSFLTNLSWVKVSASGNVKPSGFPPQSL